VTEEAKELETSGGQMLNGIKLFADVPSDALAVLSKQCQWMRFVASDIILDREDSSRDVYFLTAGKVRVMNFVGAEHEVTLAEMVAGSYFGELSAIGPRARTARIVAVELTTVAVMPREAFLLMLMDFPQVAINLLRDLAYVISSMNDRVSLLSKTNPRQRVYIELLRLAVPNPIGDGSWIIEPLPNHNDIAGWAGTEQQEVAEAIGKLAREKILQRKNRTIIIQDRARIESLSGM
jgi:CRP/FNR family cyclic AMP-dependent transcriptional regulator